MGDPGNSPNNDNKTPNSFLNQLKKNSNELINNPIQNFGSHLKSNILPNSKNFKLGESKFNTASQIAVRYGITEYRLLRIVNKRLSQPATVSAQT